MTDAYVGWLNVATSQTYVWIGTPLIIGGVLGNLLNTIIFLSLKIYRESSTAFYLTIVSIVNIGQLLTGILSLVLVNATGIDWTETSVVFCKARYTIFQACGIISPMCLCLVTVDQFLATSTRPRWQQWSNIKTAHRLSFACIVFWLLYGIPYAIYYSPKAASASRVASCTIGNEAYLKYNITVHAPVLMCATPLLVTVIFGLLAYQNVRDITHRTIPLVRRRHEMQLTTMVLVQILFNAVATTPGFITRFVSSHYPSNLLTPTVAAELRFAIALTGCIYYFYYAVRSSLFLPRFRSHSLLFRFHSISTCACRSGSANSFAM